LQPFYVWNSRHETELRVGAAVLKEALDRESEKEERITRVRQERKHDAELQAKQVKLAFEDDRRRRALHDKLEKERREAREAALAAGILPPAPARHPAQHPHLEMDSDGEGEDDDDELRPPGAFSGQGHRLTSPPPYAPDDSPAPAPAQVE